MILQRVLEASSHVSHIPHTTAHIIEHFSYKQSSYRACEQSGTKTHTTTTTKSTLDSPLCVCLTFKLCPNLYLLLVCMLDYSSSLLSLFMANAFMMMVDVFTRLVFRWIVS